MSLLAAPVFLLVVFALLLVEIVVVSYLTVRYCTRRRAAALAQPVQELQTLKPAQFDLRSLHVAQNELPASQDECTCVVCMESLRANLHSVSPDVVVKLPCGHIFHQACILAWFSRGVTCSTCPTCRCPVLGATTPSAAPRQP
jgi:hypothetical protein